ncbi:hypothetical protein JHK85_005054 [Glycine max]|nr:hypothetical protein JHK85_005054 [Glycine max]KAG5080822.1 hypothetical protein JHK86_004887 [Glycine max]
MRTELHKCHNNTVCSFGQDSLIPYTMPLSPIIAHYQVWWLAFQCQYSKRLCSK